MNTWFDQCFDKLISHEGGGSANRRCPLGKPLAFRNSTGNPSVDSADRDIFQSTSVLKKHFYAIKNDISVGACIPRLFIACCPSAVFFAVTTIIVNPIQRAALWSAAHVGKKAFVFGPLVAIGNSSAAVVWPLGSVGVVAPALHSRPNSVFSGIAIAMGGCFFGRKLFPEATATNNKAAPKRVERSYSAIPAITQVAPVAMF